MLLVNTASFCGYTPQYDGLQKLQTSYAAQGFTVVGVPSGDFLGQEYGSNKEISSFCKAKFGIKFPLAEKGDVVGKNALPIYRWAAAVLGPDNTPKWNFHKYLIGRDGRLITAFGTKVTPDAPAVTRRRRSRRRGSRGAIGRGARLRLAAAEIGAQRLGHAALAVGIVAGHGRRPSPAPDPGQPA